MKYFIATLCLLPAFSNAANFEFKGLQLDNPVTTEEVVEKLKMECSIMGNPCNEGYKQAAPICGDGIDGVKICNGSTTIASEKAYANIVISAAGNLQRIDLTFSVFSYEDILTVVKEKYGKPHSIDRHHVRNGFGQIFNQEVMEWRNRNGQGLVFSKYGYNLNKSNINFSTTTDRKSRKVKKEALSDI